MTETSVKIPSNSNLLDGLYSELISQENTQQIMISSVQGLTTICHQLAVEAGWWNDLNSGERIERNHGEIFALMHSEISEAMEGQRKNKMDDHLPHRKNVEVELADALARIFDYAGAHGLDIAGALVEKLEYNTKRADHKRENRAAPGGKKF